MVVCPYGSSAQPGAPAAYWVAGEAIDGFLGATNVSKLLPWKLLIGAELVQPPTFCLTEPPETPTITDDDVFQAVTQPWLLPGLLAKIQQGARAWAWYQWCQCNGAPTGGTGRECFAGRQYGTFDMHGDFPLRPCTGGDTVRCTISLTGQSRSAISAYIYVHGVDAGGVERWIDHVYADSTTSMVADHTFTVPGGLGITQYRVWRATNGDLTDWNEGTWCYTGPGFTGEPTIPPTPPSPSLPDTPVYPVPTGCTTDDLCKALAAVQQQLAITDRMVTLIQRQAVPFAYIPGATFAGLSGSGEVAVSGILAVAVDASDHPLASVEYGHPDERFDNGWINLGTADGWFQRVQLGPRPTFVPSVPAYCTRLGYSLPPGVTATLRTWKREV